MANPSKRRPWVLEMQAVGKWFIVDAYHTKDEAEFYARKARKDAPQTQWRTRHAFTEE